MIINITAEIIAEKRAPREKRSTPGLNEPLLRKYVLLLPFSVTQHSLIILWASAIISADTAFLSSDLSLITKYASSKILLPVFLKYTIFFWHPRTLIYSLCFLESIVTILTNYSGWQKIWWVRVLNEYSKTLTRQKWSNIKMCRSPRSSVTIFIHAIRVREQSAFFSLRKDAQKIRGA